MAGYHGFVPGEFPTAADMNDYLSKQAVMKFATTAARDSALSAVLREGMVCFIDNLNTFTVYSGSAWSTIGPVHGAPLSWTPVVVQGATPTLTVTWATYSRVGRQVICNFQVTITSGGTSTNDVSISLPVTAATSSVGHGVGGIVDTSASFEYPGTLVVTTTTTMKIKPMAGSLALNAYLGSATFTAALANTDIVYGSLSYVAAADA